MPELGAGALPWMLELAEAIKLFGPDVRLATGVIVGSAVIERVSPREDGMWQWHLADVEPAAGTGAGQRLELAWLQPPGKGQSLPPEKQPRRAPIGYDRKP